MAYPIGYAVTSSIMITAGAQSIHASLRSAFTRPEGPACGAPAVAVAPDWGGTATLTGGPPV
jgi:hypothetical protein